MMNFRRKNKCSNKIDGGFRYSLKKVLPSLLLILALIAPLMCPIGTTIISDKTNTIILSSAVAYGTGGSANTENKLRGVWVATIKNLDYPSTATTDSAVLKNEIDSIVKNTAAMGLNAIFFQVRPAADSFYSSQIFPWSKHLTGVQGKAPSNGFDPLAYIIEEAHKKDIQVHAWINPYRITMDGDDDYNNLAAYHPAKLHPEYVVKYTNNNYYFDPAIPEVRTLIVNSAAEIVENYDVDGIHMDDYFYPGPDFPDSASFEKYGVGYSDIGDWRRNNVNILIQQLDKVLHQKDPSISFGISPFGIWANKSSISSGSATNGSQSYYNMFADTKKWTEEGWIDYIAPQIYWNIGYSAADYKVLVDWWSNVVSGTDTKLYIGMAAYKAGNADSTSPWYGTAELSSQLALNKTKLHVSGEILFRYQSLMKISGVSDMIKNHYTTASKESDPITSDEPVTTINFTDLGTAKWAEDYIYKLAKKGIVSGKGNNKFEPMAQLTRSEFITMLVKTFGLKMDSSYTCSYEDVVENEWYYTYIACAKHHGILPAGGTSADSNGLTGLNTFSPNAPISREDMALFAYQALKAAAVSTDGAKVINFADKASISNQGKTDAVNSLTALGIINGYPEDNTFRPLGQATRAESSTMVCTLLDYYETFH